MYYFPIHFSMALQGSVVKDKDDVIMVGIFKKNFPDVTFFNVCNIDSEKIMGQDKPRMTVYSKEIAFMSVDVRSKFFIDNASRKHHDMVRCGDIADLCIKFEGVGREEEQYVALYADIKRTVWLKPEVTKFFCVMCIDSVHPDTVYFGIVTEDWLKEYTLPNDDSK